MLSIGLSSEMQRLSQIRPSPFLLISSADAYILLVPFEGQVKVKLSL
jgi:hypothetical protein